MPVLNRTKPQILDIPRHRILTTLPKQEGVPEPETPETQNEDKTVGAPEPETLQTLETQKVREKKNIPRSTREVSTLINSQKVCKAPHPKKNPKKTQILDFLVLNNPRHRIITTLPKTEGQNGGSTGA